MPFAGKSVPQVEVSGYQPNTGNPIIDGRAADDAWDSSAERGTCPEPLDSVAAGEDRKAAREIVERLALHACPESQWRDSGRGPAHDIAEFILVQGAVKGDAVAFQFAFLPWQIADPRSKAYVGVGAFNLVRAAAYRRAGGHAALPMDVLDDVKLGKRLKEAGGRQACGFGEGMVRVRWAVGARGVIRGLDKNAFAVFGFRPGPVVVSIGMVLLLVVWPGAGLFVGPWGARLLCAGTLASMAWIVRMIPPAPGVSPLYGLCFPAAALLFAYAILRSMVGAYRRGGVVWRGTLYPLADLRRGVV